MFFSLDELLEATGGRLVNQFRKDGISAVTTDSRKNIPNALFFAIPGEKFDGHDYLVQALENGADLLCIEEKSIAKLPENAPAIVVPFTIPAYQKLAAYHRRKIDPKVIALTGSCGKTSTKEMLRAIFQEAYGKDAVLATEGNTNNQIGVPQNLFRLEPQHKYCIIEMGTNHHGEIEPLSAATEPSAALIVSIARCHLENLGSLEGVAVEKSNIFRYLHGTAVIPADAPGFDIMKKAAGKNPIITFGSSKADFDARPLGGTIRGSVFELKDNRSGKTAKVEWRLLGAHQAKNAAGAAALASSFGIPLDVIAKGLSNCVLPGMRMKITDHGGATWINDAYNANPDSMRASLSWLAEFADPAKLLLVVGDMLELGDAALQSHIEILDFAEKNLKGASVIAVGPVMMQASQKFPGIRAFPNSAEAVETVRKSAKPGNIVFLKASRGTKLELTEPEE